MKNHPYLNLFCVLVALAIGLSIGAATQERIRWHLDNYTVYQCCWTNGHRIDFGLRNDGVVVWREIMPSITNSPAEQVEVLTNLMMTNLWWSIDTNRYLRNP